jgi:hypothetical protein
MRDNIMPDYGCDGCSDNYKVKLRNSFEFSRISLQIEKRTFSSFIFGLFLAVFPFCSAQIARCHRSAEEETISKTALKI